MVRKKKLSKYLIVSSLIHVFIALAMSRIYAEQPQRHGLLRIVSTVKIQYKEPEPPPEPKVVTKVQPKKKAEPEKEKPKVVQQKVDPPEVTQQKSRIKVPAPGLSLESAPQRSMSAPGVAGLKATRSTGVDLPGMRASGGISHPSLTTRAGGSGLSPGQTHGSMEMPTGSDSLPGAGGRQTAGFQIGASQAGKGIGRVDIPGRGESGEKSVDGPDAGPITDRINIGGGEKATGLDVGTSDGMGEVESETTDGKPGGEAVGPGIGKHDTAGPRSGPSLEDRAGTGTEKGKELPATKELPEEKRDEARGKKDFKADLGKSMTSAATKALEEPASRGFEDVLQGEINRNLYSLRKIHEDWQNRKIPNIPKVLQFTIELGIEKGKPKLLKVDFHNAALATRIKDDLTRKIGEWKFESLYDGKDDPKKWPVKLSGKVSWQ